MASNKRRICSYDMAAVAEHAYVVTDEEGEIFFCNARCLCIWAVSLATKLSKSEESKPPGLTLETSAGLNVRFPSLIGLARWASVHALGTPD